MREEKLTMIRVSLTKNHTKNGSKEVRKKGRDERKKNQQRGQVGKLDNNHLLLKLI